MVNGVPVYDPRVAFRLVEARRALPIEGLVDSGATNTLISTDYSDVLELDLTLGRPVEVPVGGGTHEGREMTVTLECIGVSFDASVVFCKEWHHPFALLGNAFFMPFAVTFELAHDTFEIETLGAREFR